MHFGQEKSIFIKVVRFQAKYIQIRAARYAACDI